MKNFALNTFPNKLAEIDWGARKIPLVFSYVAYNRHAILIVLDEKEESSSGPQMYTRGDFYFIHLSANPSKDPQKPFTFVYQNYLSHVVYDIFYNDLENNFKDEGKVPYLNSEPTTCLSFEDLQNMTFEELL